MPDNEEGIKSSEEEQVFTHYESPEEELRECEMLYEDGLWS